MNVFNRETIKKYEQAYLSFLLSGDEYDYIFVPKNLIDNEDIRQDFMETIEILDMCYGTFSRLVYSSDISFIDVRNDSVESVFNDNLTVLFKRSIKGD